MIPIEYYTDVFYIIISLIIILGILPLFKYKLDEFPLINLELGAFVLIVFSILMIGLRDPYGSWRYLGDTSNYTRTYEITQNSLFWKVSKDIGFYVYMKLCSQFFSVKIFYLITATLYVLLPFFTFRKWFKQYSFFVLALYISSISFWGFGINGIRNGLATSIFIYSLGFLNRKLIFGLLALLAISFHKSLILPAVAIIFAEFFTNTRLLLRIWFLTILISYFFGRQINSIMASIINSENEFLDNRTTGLLNASEEVLSVSSSAFRFDFIVYSAIIILFGFIYSKKYKNKFYTQVYNAFIVVNTIWLFFIYVPFTNRIAYLSWFLLPIILFYPILREKIYIHQNKIILYSLLGSLGIMWVLYLN